MLKSYYPLAKSQVQLNSVYLNSFTSQHLSKTKRSKLHIGVGVRIKSNSTHLHASLSARLHFGQTKHFFTEFLGDNNDLLVLFINLGQDISLSILLHSLELQTTKSSD